MYKWTYLENRNRITDVENNFMATKVEWEGKDKLGRLGQTSTHYYI